MRNIIDYQIEFWQHIACDYLQTKEYFIFTSLVEHNPMLNLLIIKSPTTEVVQEALPVATQFFKQHQVAWSISLPATAPLEIKNLLNQQRALKNTHVNMQLELPKLQEPTLAGHQIVKVTTQDQLKLWAAVVNDGFGLEREHPMAYYHFNKRMLNSKMIEYYLLMSPNEAISAYSVVIFTDQVARLDNVATRKQYQRQGYGKLLLKHSFWQAQQHNCHKTILESTAAGLEVYKKLGFQEINVTEFYY